MDGLNWMDQFFVFVVFKVNRDYFCQGDVCYLIIKRKSFYLLVFNILFCSFVRVFVFCGMWQDCILLVDKRYVDIIRNCIFYYICYGGMYFGYNFCNLGMYYIFIEIGENVIVYM